MDNPNAEINVGTSDQVILVISLIGFILIGSTLYVLLPKTGPSIQLQQVPVDENNDNRNVGGAGGGNRAQRRARARRRRVENEIEVEVEEKEEEEEDNDDEGREAGEEENNPDDAEAIPMSRKERLKAAKRAEKEERRRMEEQRLEELRQRKEAEEAAYLERKEKEREQDELQKQKEEKGRKQLELEEQKKYNKWKNSFVLQGTGTDKGAGGGTFCTPIWTEGQWNQFMEYIQETKIVSLHSLATRFRITLKEVSLKLLELEQSGKLIGIFNQRGDFIHITHSQMDAIAEYIRDHGKIITNELPIQIANAKRL